MIQALQNIIQTPGALSSNTQGAAIAVGHAETASASIVVTGTGSGSVQFQVSNDGLNWAPYGAPVSIAGAGVYTLEMPEITYLNVCLNYVVNSGSFTPSSIVILKGTA